MKVKGSDPCPVSCRVDTGTAPFLNIPSIIGKTSVKKEDEHQFTAEDSWGALFPLSKLHDKSGGYLVNDTCLIEVEVSEPDALQFFSNKPLDSSAPHDSAESVYTQAESFLKKSTSPISDDICEVPSFEDHAISAKECFNNLVSSPLDDLVDPKHETAMIESLSIVSDNLSLFSHKQAEEIMNLKASFPDILRDWRDSFQVKVSNHHLWSTFEKTNNLLEDLVKNEEELNIKLEELNKREEKMNSQLEVFRSKRGQLQEETIELSKQRRQVYGLAEKQFRRIDTFQANHRLSSTFEKTNNLLGDLVENEERINIQLLELNEKEKELQVHSKVLRSERLQLREEIIELSKQRKLVYGLAEKQHRKIKGKEAEVDLANKKLEDMKCKWASIKPLFC